jgi:DNA repair protein RadC
MNLFLGNQHRVRSSEGLFTGTVKAASVYPRKAIKKALAENASAVVFYHNHPSGVAERDPFARCRLCLGNISIH